MTAPIIQTGKQRPGEAVILENGSVGLSPSHTLTQETRGGKRQHSGCPVHLTPDAGTEVPPTAQAWLPRPQPEARIYPTLNNKRSWLPWGASHWLRRRHHLPHFVFVFLPARGLGGIPWAEERQGVLFLDLSFCGHTGRRQAQENFSLLWRVSRSRIDTLEDRLTWFESQRCH